MNEKIKNWKVWIGVAVLILAVALGAFVMYKLKVEPLQEQNEVLFKQVQGLILEKEALEKSLGILQKQKDEVRTQVVTLKETEIQYVEKEIDPLTGEKEKTDFQVNTENTKLHVMVNDKPFEVPILAGENYAMENGKLVLRQTSMATVDIKLPEVKRQGLRVGTFVDYNSGENQFNVGAKARYEWKKSDAELSINQDKKIKGSYQYWFK